MTRLAVVVALIATLTVATPATVAADVERGDRGAEVRQVQEQLRDYGYVGVEADGVFGKQTERAVRHFQRSSGLTVDGVVGDITAGALRGPQIALTTPPAPPAVGAGLTGCPEMQAYRVAAGLPEQFDAIGYRESRCQNDAKPTSVTASRYRGWWSVGVMHIKNAVYGPGAAACGITTEADYYGNSPEQKRASACFAKVLYDVSGLSPWAL